MLADFGLSRMQRDHTELMTSDLSGMKGTLPYCAPELLSDKPTPCQSSRDIWALGMVIYRVFTGDSPYKEHVYPMGIMNAIKRGARPKARNYVAKKRGFTDELWDFLEKYCWNIKEKERQSASGCRARFKSLTSRWELEKADKIVAREVSDFLIHADHT
jgi:serine/threonine protein kinase